MQNSNITKYIHIGLPKNLSSTLQQYFFPVHPDIYHLGIGNGDSLIDYIDNDINILFENYLMYSKDFEYQHKKTFFTKKISRHIERAIATNKKAIGVSLELLSFSFTPDMIDVTQKAERLLQLFGRDTEIVLVLRNQKSLLESMYREFIKVGYDKSYKEYIDFIYLNQSRSFLHDFLFDNLVELYSNLFGIDNVNIMVIENYRSSNGNLVLSSNQPILIEDLCQILNIDNIQLTIGHNNQALSKSELFQKMQLNNKYHHDLGNGLFEGADKHRLNKYYKYDLQYDFPDPFHDVKIKRNLIDYSQVLAKHDTRVINYAADTEILKKLSAMFTESNKRLSDNYNIALPESYFNLEF